MKKFLAILLVCTVLLGLCAGCSKGNTTSDADVDAPKSGSASASAVRDEDGNATDLANDKEFDTVEGQSEDETLTIALESEPNTILWTKGSSSTQAGMVISCMVDPLFKWDYKTGEIINYLAEGYEWVDETHFRVTLKQGITFHDGTPFNADSVIANAKLSAGITSGGIFDYENWTKESDYSVIVALNYTYVLAPDQLSIGSNQYSPKAIEAHGGADTSDLVPKQEIGSGKYSFVEWVPGQYVLLERYEDYWNKEEMPYYKYMKFVFVNDSAARALAVESGDADIACNLPTNMGGAYEGNDALIPYYVDTLQAGTLYLNQDNPNLPDNPLKDVRVREAIWLLIDVEAMDDLTSAGRGRFLETVISPYSIVYDAPPEGYSREVNIERAKELLAEAGYPDGFTLKSINFSIYPTQMEVVKECLRLGGIELDYQNLEVATMMQGLRSGDYTIAWTALSAVNYLQNVRLVDGRIPHSEVSGGYGVTDPAFYEIADRCYSAFDMDERMEAFKEFQDYMKENYIAVGLSTNLKLELCRAGITCGIITGGGGGAMDYTVVRPLSE